MMSGTFGINGERLHLVWKDENCTQGVYDFRTLTPIQWQIWSRLQRELKQRGFTITAPKRFIGRRIRKLFFDATSDDLEAFGEVSGIGLSSIELHPLGGRYLLGDARKRTYRQDLGMRAVLARFRTLLVDLGFREVRRPVEPDAWADPLAFFQHHWGRSDWPDLSHPGSMYGATTDRDGKPLGLGCLKHTRSRSGRLLYGQAFPFLNGNWLFVFGKDHLICHAKKLFDAAHNEPRKLSTERRARLYGEKLKAINQENYERAALLRDIMRREEAADPSRRAA